MNAKLFLFDNFTFKYFIRDFLRSSTLDIEESQFMVHTNKSFNKAIYIDKI